MKNHLDCICLVFYDFFSVRGGGTTPQMLLTVKAKYRKLAVQKHLEQLEEGKRTYQVFYFDRYDNA